MPQDERTQSGSPRQQTIEELQKRYKRLDETRIAADANRKTAQARVDELKADAKAKYGTDELEELKVQLTEIIAENERKRCAYQLALDAIEGNLGEVERSFAEAERAAKATGSGPRT